MSEKFSKKNIVANEKSEKFFLRIGEWIWYNSYNHRKQKTFEADFETRKTLALNQRGYSSWERRGKRQTFFCRN